MKIIKGNHEYTGMFWNWIWWNSLTHGEKFGWIYSYTIAYLLPYNKPIKIKWRKNDRNNHKM